MDERGKKMSKRDPRSNLLQYKEAGYLPEGVLNYVATLGWSLSGDRDVFSVAEFLEAFDLHDVKSNPARFDEKKFDAICSDHFRSVDAEELTEMLVPRLQAAGLVGAAVTPEQAHVLEVAVPLVQERCTTLAQAVEMLRFLFCGTEVELDEDSAKKTFKDDAAQVLDASIASLEGIDWTTEAIEEALKAALVEGLGLKPRKAFGPVRVAISGKTVSPPLYESMELLGRDVSLARLRAARATL